MAGREAWLGECRQCGMGLLRDEGEHCDRCYEGLPRVQQMADDEILCFLTWVDGLPPTTALEAFACS